MILINGKKIAAELREELRQEVVELKAKHNKIPETLSSLLSSSILFNTVFSSTASGYLITSDFNPTSFAYFSLLRT